MINLHLKYNKKQKGAALIITLLLISVFASLIFVTSRISSNEFRQTTSLEDAELAFLAAQSGIETGLLFFRYDKNSEVPINYMTEESKEFLRYNLSDAQVENNIDNANLDSSKSYFDLQIWHRNISNVEHLKSKDCNQVEISKDLCREIDGKYIMSALKEGDIVEYDINGISNIKFSDIDFITNNGDEKLEVIFISSVEQKSVIISDTNRVQNSLNAEKMRIKTYNGDLKNIIIEASEPSSTHMDSRYTTIRSTGYYGRAKRTLEVKVDRATGSLLSPFDFSIISTEKISSNVPVPPRLICKSYKAIKITNTGNTDLNDYQIKVNVPLTASPGLLKDIKFISNTGADLNFWTASPETNNGDVWIKVDSIKANSSSYIYMQYTDCNGGLSMSGKDTFELYDHFDNLEYSKSIWDNASSVDMMVRADRSEVLLNPNRKCDTQEENYLFSKEANYTGSKSVYTLVKSNTDRFRYSVGFNNIYYNYDRDLSNRGGFILNNVLQLPTQGYEVKSNQLQNKTVKLSNLDTKTILDDTNRSFSINNRAQNLGKIRIGAWCESQIVLDLIYAVKSADIEPTAQLQ